MKEIKFRAWDYNNEKVIPWENIRIEKDENEANLSVVVFDGSIGDHFDDFPIMQYTGLYDKNGTPIYEEDIVHFVNFDTTGGHLGDIEHTGVVKYQSGIYEIWKNNDSEYYGSDGAFILNHAWLQDDEFEVIGNIYENPELLEVEANA